MSNTESERRQLLVQINRTKDLIEAAESQLEDKPNDSSLKRRLEGLQNQLRGLEAEMDS